MGQCLSSPAADRPTAKRGHANTQKPVVKEKANAARPVEAGKSSYAAKKATAGQLPPGPTKAGTIPAGEQQYPTKQDTGLEQYAELASSPEESQASGLSDPEEFQTYEEGHWLEGDEEGVQESPTAEPISIDDIRVLNSAPSHSEGHGVIPIRRSKAGSLTADHAPGSISGTAEAQPAAAPHSSQAQDESAVDKQQDITEEQSTQPQQQQACDGKPSCDSQHSEQQADEQRPPETSKCVRVADAMQPASDVSRKAGVLIVQPDAGDENSRQSSLANSCASTPTGHGHAGSHDRPSSTTRSSPLPRVAMLPSKLKTADAVGVSVTPSSDVWRPPSPTSPPSKGPVSMWAPGKTPPPPSRIPVSQAVEDVPPPGVTPSFAEQRSRARSMPGSNSHSPKKPLAPQASVPRVATAARKSSTGGASLTSKAATSTSTGAGASPSPSKPKVVRMASDKGMTASSSKLQASKSLPAKVASPHKAPTGADRVAAEARARRRAKSTAGTAAATHAAKAAASSPKRSAKPRATGDADAETGAAEVSTAAAAVVQEDIHVAVVSQVEQEAGMQQAGLAPLEYGRWVLTRAGCSCTCAAKHGTVLMDTLEGQQELFQCSVQLQEGGLVAACLHDSAAAGTSTWLFCPDPLCLASKPEGSQLPDWPWALPVQLGVELSNSEQEEVLELGITPLLQAAEERTDGLQAETSDVQ